MQKNHGAAVAAKKSLFDQIGGKQALSAVVDDFYQRVLGDTLLKPFFNGTDMQKQKKHQVAFLTMALGGPSAYAGKAMKAAHVGRGIENRHFDAVAGHLQASLVAAGVGKDQVQTILAAAASLRADVVG